MRRAIAPLVILLLALLLPIVPFVIWGDTIEPAVERWVRESESKPLVFALVIVALATDVVLPIPSSFVSTFAGARLGFLPALMASTIGMTLGALVAFALARRWGSSLARRFTAAGDLERMEALAGHYGPLAIAISRPLPVLAEATVLVLGTIRLPWRRFWPTMLLANLGIALTSVLGALASQQGGLVVALVGSITLPLAATLIARRWLKRAV